MTAPVRIQRHRTKGWRKPEGAVVVTRPGLFGNPWIPGRPGRVVLGFGDDARSTLDAPLPREMGNAMAVAAFRGWIKGGEVWRPLMPDVLSQIGELEARRWLDFRRDRVISRLPELRGKDLCCWCPLDQPCHADVLLDLANGRADT